jgi:hypothetical protein
LRLRLLESGIIPNQRSIITERRLTIDSSASVAAAAAVTNIEKYR